MLVAAAVLAACGGGAATPTSGPSPAATVSESTVAPAPSTLDTGDVEGFEITTITVGDRSLTVAVADTPARRAQGLMGVRDLGDLDGMLFVFDRVRPVAFWMKDTLIPLRVGYFDAQGVLFQVERMEPCPGDDCPTYPSSGDVRWALEIPADRDFPPLGSVLSVPDARGNRPSR